VGTLDAREIGRNGRGFEERLLSIWLAGWGFGQVSSTVIMVVHSSFFIEFPEKTCRKPEDWRLETGDGSLKL